MSDIAHFKIPIFDFPADPDEDDDQAIQENNECRSMLPFSVIGMEHQVKIGGEILVFTLYLQSIAS